MKVAIYINNLAHLESTSRIAYMLARAWKKQGHHVEFLINKPPIELAKEFPIRVLKGKGDLFRAKEIGEILQKENFDGCLAFMRPQSTVLGLARLLKPQLKTKLVASIRNNDNYRSYNRWYQIPYRLLEKFLLEKNDRIVAISYAVKEDIEKAFFINPQKISVVYNPIDVEAVRKLAKEPIDRDEEQIFEAPTIINVARLEEQKGLHHLIKAFYFVQKKVAESRLVLVGDGSLRKDLENLARQLGIRDKVHFLGWRKNPFKYLTRAKVFAFTSIWEGFGLALLEAMALNIPIVAFKTKGGHAEFLKDCCPLVDYPKEEALAEEIVKLLTDKQYYRTIREKVQNRVKEFHYEKAAQKYLEQMI